MQIAMIGGQSGIFALFNQTISLIAEGGVESAIKLWAMHIGEVSGGLMLSAQSRCIILRIMWTDWGPSHLQMYFFLVSYHLQSSWHSLMKVFAFSESGFLWHCYCIVSIHISECK